MDTLTAPAARSGIALRGIRLARFAAASAWVFAVSLGYAAEPAALAAQDAAFFEKKILPVLAEHCYQCHSAQAEKLRADLRLDYRDGVLRGGASGAVIVPGDPAKSLLITAIKWDDSELQMPPKEKLPAAVIADFEQWVRMGAPDPRTAASSVAPSAPYQDPAAAKDWWSFQPVKKSPPPQVKNTTWPRGAIDKFVLAKLESRGLKPVVDADQRTLIRRLYFDLTGLPPTPREIDEFLGDKTDGAVEKMIDRLLASPRFGERWGRHWLDVARYGESTGKDLNVALPHAWRYRDYVISAFNKDKPYDRFVREQIAGDLLPAADARQRAEQLIATGFLAIGPKGLGELTPRQFALDVADEQVGAVSQAFMGLTVSCARCHDHKFDPISQRDYYAVAGIFLSTKTHYGTLAGPKNNQESDLIELPPQANLPVLRSRQTVEERERFKRAFAGATAQYEKLMASRGQGQINAAQRFIQIQVAIGRKAQLESELNSFDEAGQPKAFAMGVQDKAASPGPLAPMRPAKIVEIKGSSGIRPPSGFETIADSPWFARGEISDPRDRVPRGFPAFLTWAGMPAIAENESGRKQLADWLASEKHPLTARVMANRIWHWLFGRGIVASVDNFGTMGELPSNRALLDYLASRLVENDWSIKKTIREIVLSRTYQLASTYDETAFAADPQNMLTWRHAKRRLDAESIRDAVLASSGKLELEAPAGSALALAGDGPIGSNGPFIKMDEDIFANATSNHRSVYLPIVRDLIPDALAVFDHSDASLVTGARETTNVPAQALYFLNNEFVRTQAKHFAERAITAYPPSDSKGSPLASFRERVNLAFNLAFGRPANRAEQKTAADFFTPGRDILDAWIDFCLALYNTGEFRYLN